MKKMTLYISGILLAIIVAVGYHFSFPIKSDCSDLETYIIDQLNRGYSSVEYLHEINLYDSVTLGNLTYHPIEVGEQLGYVLLKEGITGRHKIISSTYGGGSFRKEIVDVDGQNHLLFIGRNTFGEISEVKFTLDANHQYSIDVPKQKVFSVYTEVDNDTQIGPGLDMMKLYNVEGQDITLEF